VSGQARAMEHAICNDAVPGSANMLERSRPSILVVDNDRAALGGLVELLREQGYHVRSADSFEDAKRLLTAQYHDVLITDVRLGPYNGLQLVVRIRHLQPSTVAIVVTAFPDPVLAEEARRLGAAYAAKPLRPAEFLALVASTLAASTDRPTR
jgi:DNA-binding response OmpR family regulator